MQRPIGRAIFPLHPCMMTQWWPIGRTIFPTKKSSFYQIPQSLWQKKCCDQGSVRPHWAGCTGITVVAAGVLHLLCLGWTLSNEVSTEGQIEKQGCESWKDTTNTNKPSKKGTHCYSSYSYYWRKSTSFTFCWNNSYTRDMQRAMETKFHRSTFLQAVLLAANARWTKVIRISHLASNVSNIAWCIGEVDSPLWLIFMLLD